MPSTESLIHEFQEMAKSGRYAEILERLRILTGFDQLYKIYWSLFAFENIGHIEDGIEYFKANERVIKNDERKELKPKIWNTVGSLYYKHGKTLIAYEYFQRGFETALVLNQKEDVSIALNNLGILNVTRGNLDKGLEFYEKCLEHAIKENDKSLQSKSLYNIADIHLLRKDFEKAKTHFLESLKLRREIGNKTRIAQTLKALMEVEFESEDPDMDVITPYRDELQKIANDKNTELTMLYYLVSKALLFKWFEDHHKAEMIYRKVIDDNQEIDTTISSILNLIEIFFIKYRESLDSEILNSIHYYLDKMFQISKSQFSFRYLVKSLILKSQLSSIEGHFDEAYVLIEKALQATEDQQMEYLRNEILTLKDRLTNEYNKLKDLFENDSSVLSRLDNSSIMELLKVSSYV